MEEQEQIKNKKHPLVPYFKSLEEKVPEDEIAKRWDELMRRQKSLPSTRQYKMKRMFVQVACAAAVLGIIWGISLYFENRVPSMDEAIAQLDECVMDTTHQVLLITQTEQQIEAGKEAHISYSQNGNVLVNQRPVDLKKETSPKTAYNQLIVPKGKSSYLVLADGTSLHVNSGTKVLYPSTFRGKYREIYVDGEIYIDVAKNTEQPFIVKTPEFDIRVTGTAFNVNAYKSMHEAEVVLLRGAIVVTDYSDHEVDVKPNELLCLNNGIVSSKREVDASEYIAWTKGHFPLQGRSMESILRRLSLYYGCEITCDSSVKALSLLGTIDMSVSLDTVLDRIAKIHPVGVRQTANGYHLFMNQKN